MIESVPLGNASVLRVATPLTSVPVPIVVVPFLKRTLPVGVGPEAAVTVAVNVTVFPDTDGFGELVTVVTVGTNTTCVKTGETLVASFELPS